MLLEVRNLIIEFCKDDNIIKAVDSITFEINQGEILGIVGESGTGKSVTALSIMQLIAQPQGKISSGEIIYHHNNSATDLLKLNKDEMIRFRGNEIAMIFQEPVKSLNPVLRCGDQVAEAIVLHQHVTKKEAYIRTIELFKKVELTGPENIYESYPFQLSGGQKQRVAIAMAISCKPQLLIADEPTSALDVTVQKSIIKLLKQIQAETGMSIIFITHDLGLIAELANRVMVMREGKIVEQGSITDVFSDPQHPYTKALLSCRPINHPKGKRLPMIKDFMEVKRSKLEIGNWKLGHDSENKSIDSDLQNAFPILKVKNLKTYFPIRKGIFGKMKGEVKAVDDVSFEVMKGETLGLVGESGCGKTTLGRTILRLIEPTSGSVVFKDENLMELDKFDIREMRKHIQIIFQDPYSSLNPRITAGEAITEPMRIHRLYSGNSQRKEKAMELLQKVNLSEEYFNRYPHEFSGGQRQRIVIARALGLNPEFVICDESVSALDVSVQAQVLNLLNDLKKESNFTYIFISHDLSVVKYMSDRMIVMNNGKIEEIGVPDEIYNNPKSEYTRRLIDAMC
ncbi:MAG: ABC transporter ATP-binding protein [Bacteroidia bacterium]